MLKLAGETTTAACRTCNGRGHVPCPKTFSSRTHNWNSGCWVPTRQAGDAGEFVGDRSPCNRADTSLPTALIRVTIHDWINKDRAVHLPPNCRVFIHWHGLPEHEAVSLFDGEPYARFSGPTQLQAMIAGAHAIADAQGVLP